MSRMCLEKEDKEGEHDIDAVEHYEFEDLYRPRNSPRKSTDPVSDSEDSEDETGEPCVPLELRGTGATDIQVGETQSQTSVGGDADTQASLNVVAATPETIPPPQTPITPSTPSQVF